VTLHRRVALLLAASLLASACQGEDAVPEQTTGPSPSTVPSSTTRPAASNVEVEVGPGSFDLVDPRSGLADLAGYRQALVVSFEGTKDGQPHQWSKTITLVHTGEPLASMLTIESSGDVAAADPAVIAEATGALYQIGPDGTCTGEPLDPTSSPIALQEPAALLGGLLGAEETGSEEANGVAALHYTFDERAMAESGRAETDGEVWVAADGGQVVRYVRTTSADAAYFGEGVEGTATWAYDLTEIGEQPAIALPPGCQVDAPSMVDATNLQVLPTWMGFDTTASVEEVTAFYQGQLPGRGWASSGDPLVDPVATAASYARGNEELTVIAIAGDTGTRVDILLGPASG
jgi:hypothetical protein